MASDPEAAWLRRHAAAERLLAKTLRRYFREQAKRIAAAIDAHDGELSPAVVPLVFSEATEHDLLLDAMSDPIITLMVQSALPALPATPPDAAQPIPLPLLPESKAFDWSKLKPSLPDGLTDRIRREWERIAAADYWRHIGKATAEQLAELIQAGIDAGRKGAALVKSVLRGLSAINKVRVGGIATTEATGALNAGKRVAADAAGLRKTWLAVDDELTRESHAAADGQEAGADGLFVVGGEKCEYPGDPSLSAAERCGCRCTVAVDDRPPGSGATKQLPAGLWLK